MRIFVGNIDFAITSKEIVEFLEEKIGPIANFVYVRNRDNEKFRGFVFVDFQNEGDDQRCLDELHNAEFKGRKLNVATARPRPTRH